MIKKFFSVFLIFIFLFSGSVIAQNEEYEKERIRIVNIINEAFSQLKSYPDWNDPSLYNLRIQKVGKEILVNKYKIEFEDYAIILKAAITGKKDCEIILFVFIVIRGKDKKQWFDERAIACIDPLQVNKKEKIKV